MLHEEEEEEEEEDEEEGAIALAHPAGHPAPSCCHRSG
jgi:hypothetical protein